DAAYHQGTVWCWLIGPFIDAWIRVHPDDRQGARRFLQGFEDHLGEACLGSISEICDAEPPFTPRGCVAQAWSVAEVLRCCARGRKRISVTVLDVEDRVDVVPGLHLFQRVVAENGAMIYHPGSKQIVTLAEPPAEKFITALKRHGVAPISVGHVIVATWKPHE